MKKTSILLVLATICTFAVSLWIVPEANAIPAFARQTGLACSTCHFQHFPELNAYGRAFKAGGYTQIGSEGKIEGEDLSIPDTLNAALVTKVRYQKTNGKDYTGNAINGSKGTNKGELQFPDEAAIYLAGRGGEHIGFLLEASLAESNTAATEFTNFKMPIIYDISGTKVGVIPFTTNAGGAAYGFELLNTGAIAMQRVFEHGLYTTAQKYIGTTDASTAAAEGFAFVAASDMFFVNYSLWAPAHGTTDFGPFMSYLRVAATPNVGGWDLGVGGQLWRGTGKSSGTAYTKANAFAVDAQLQGNVGLPLGVYLTYGDAKKKKVGNFTNLFNSSATGDKKAWSVLAELGVLPGKVTVGAGYLSGKTGATANNKQTATTLAATYHITQNVRFELDHSMFSGSYYDLAANNEQADGDRLTTLMLFAAF